MRALSALSLVHHIHAWYRRGQKRVPRITDGCDSRVGARNQTWILVREQPVSSAADIFPALGLCQGMQVEVRAGPLWSAISPYTLVRVLGVEFSLSSFRGMVFLATDPHDVISP